MGMFDKAYRDLKEDYKKQVKGIRKIEEVKEEEKPNLAVNVDGNLEKNLGENTPEKLN